MVPTFSTPTKIVTARVTITSALPQGATEADVRQVAEDALRRIARDNGVAVDAVQVSVADGPRTVTLTEDEYNTLRQGGNPGA